MMSDNMRRANQLRNDDCDRVCAQANGYFLGVTPENELVIALDVDGQPERGLFLNAESARNFLDRFTAEMLAMGWLA